MNEQQRHTLLRTGAGDWDALNAEKRRLLTPPTGTAVEDLLRQGQALSRTAARLASAIERTDDGSAPAT